MASVIGVVGDVLGIYSFISSLFAATGSNICTVRVSAALNGGQGGGNPSAADGTIQAVRLYNENQQIIGNIGSGYVSSGGFKDFQISQTNTQQATYVQVGATNDAICIPYMTTTWVDGGRYGWVGDFGYTCGLQWYYGNVYVDSKNRKPRCTWIDNDHTNGYKAGMLFIHWPSFAGNKAHSNNPKDYCGFPEFRAYTQNTGGSAIFRRGESVAKNRKRVVDSRLVISSEPSHNATALCESETSRGPDFVSLFEGVHCNMETSEILPLCDDNITADCFNLDGNAKVKRDGETSQKDYTDVIKWD